MTGRTKHANTGGCAVEVRNARAQRAQARRHGDHVQPPIIHRCYTIDASLERFGAMEPLSPDEESPQYCYRYWYGRESSCADCPARECMRDATTRTYVRLQNEKSRAYEIVTAEPAGGTRVRLHAVIFGEPLLSQLIEKRIDSMVQQAQLTQREQEVLQYVLAGRSSEDVANALGISPRTVKHHKANLLNKLSAESVQDLLRVLL